ncbi:hypothetical protein [Streptomyces lydicamycinicus]|uniref:hypothetical protein n=1 Tax=Streptomyces lydicamycinicus TaxID=1546107 RepID=UPI003C2FC981
MTIKTDWPFGNDADRDDPLTALRIPVTGVFPLWNYIATFDRSSEARPTGDEARMLASFIEEYKACYLDDLDDYDKAGVTKRPLDISDTMTKTFHKWDEDDWSYRVITWAYGPLWVPVAPRWRDGQNDGVETGPLPLEQVMDRCQQRRTERSREHWVEWKAAHPEVFGGAA